MLKVYGVVEIGRILALIRNLGTRWGRVCLNLWGLKVMKRLYKDSDPVSHSKSFVSATKI